MTPRRSRDTGLTFSRRDSASDVIIQCCARISLWAILAFSLSLSLSLSLISLFWNRKTLYCNDFGRNSCSMQDGSSTVHLQIYLSLFKLVGTERLLLWTGHSSLKETNTFSSDPPCFISTHARVAIHHRSEITHLISLAFPSTFISLSSFFLSSSEECVVS